MAKRIAYSDELAAELCGRLLQRDDQGRIMSLRQVCAAEDMPAESTVFLWLSQHQTFMEMYTRAREERAHLAAEDVIEIADAATDANLAKVRIDARKWYAGKLNAKHYGDKMDLSGGIRLIHEKALDDLE